MIVRYETRVQVFFAGGAGGRPALLPGAGVPQHFPF
jgi:hypothetical protein